MLNRSSAPCILPGIHERYVSLKVPLLIPPHFRTTQRKANSVPGEALQIYENGDPFSTHSTSSSLQFFYTHCSFSLSSQGVRSGPSLFICNFLSVCDPEWAN